MWRKKHGTLKLREGMRQDGTWDLGPFAAVLVPGQTPPGATEDKETMKAKYEQ